MQTYQKTDSNMTGILKFSISKQVRRNTDICLEMKQSFEVKATLFVRTNDKIKFICVEVYWKGQLSRGLGFQIRIHALKSTVRRWRPNWSPWDADLFAWWQRTSVPVIWACRAPMQGTRLIHHKPICCETECLTAPQPRRPIALKTSCLTEIASQLREVAAKNRNVFFPSNNSLLGPNKEM